MKNKIVLLTGASGFIGRNACPKILEAGWRVRATPSRTAALNYNHERLEWTHPFYINADTNWLHVLDGVTDIVHLAGMAHIEQKKSSKIMTYINEVNYEGTKTLLKHALRAGVKRFIFISSIGAVANSSKEPLTPMMVCRPTTFYGCSKLAVEKMIEENVVGTNMSYTIIRPPLVYGPGNPGNMAKMFSIVASGLWLPVSAFDCNRRSFVGVSNLIDLILLCLKNPASRNQTFHVSDNDDISTGELLRRINKALKKEVRQISIPQAILKTGLILAGKGKWVDKLFGDLRVDISMTKRILKWEPKIAMGEELGRAAKWLREIG